MKKIDLLEMVVKEILITTPLYVQVNGKPVASVVNKGKKHAYERVLSLIKNIRALDWE